MSNYKIFVNQTYLTLSHRLVDVVVFPWSHVELETGGELICSPRVIELGYTKNELVCTTCCVFMPP